MPYLGNTPSTSFATVVKDSFSGDGSTVAFTLSKVATTNSVSVFVENVRQEPTTAYAVSGTTLTFTAAPVTSSGNNIYVLHMNPTTTTTHPAAQALTATTGTFTSTVDVNGNELILDADADTSITADTDDRIDFKTGGTDRLQVQSTSGNNVVIADGLTLTDGDITVANGHGINFAATSDASGMASELLDDYEEGSWTPAWSQGITSPTYSVQHGRYTKTGNVCTAYLYLTITNGTDGSAVAAISGLPFTSAATMYWVATGYNNSSDNNNDNVKVLCFPGTTSLYFYSQGLQGVSSIPGNNLGATTSQLWQITYRTA